jgi:hypothetical protein
VAWDFLARCVGSGPFAPEWKFDDHRGIHGEIISCQFCLSYEPTSCR